MLCQTILKTKYQLIFNTLLNPTRLKINKTNLFFPEYGNNFPFLGITQHLFAHWPYRGCLSHRATNCQNRIY